MDLHVDMEETSLDTLFSQIKALKGGDVGIQIDIYGNCYVYRSLPKYDMKGRLANNVHRQTEKFIVSNNGRVENEENIIRLCT